MTKPQPRRLPLIGTLLLLVLSPSGFAGIADVASTDGTQMRYEYSEDKLRLSMPNDPASYMLLRDGKIYVVSDNNGQPLVIDASAAWSMAGGMIDTSSHDLLSNEMVAMEATGKKETHAGISGEVYTIRFKDGNGKEQQTDMVLTDDPRAVAFRDVLQHFAETAAAAMGKDSPVEGQAMQANLEALKKGVLRVGNDMKVVALSDAKVDTVRFELPAQPMKMPSFGNFRLPQGADGKGEAGSTSSMEDLGKAIGNIFGQ